MYKKKRSIIKTLLYHITNYSMIKLVSENSGSYIYIYINYHSFILVFKIDNVFRRFKCIFIYVMYARGGFFYENS